MRQSWVVDTVTWSVLMTSATVVAVLDGFHAKRLYDDMLKKSKYNRLIRPVSNESDSLPVRVGLRLTSIIDVVSTDRLFLLESLVYAPHTLLLASTLSRFKHYIP